MALIYGQNTQSPIHFTHKPIDFKLDSSERPSTTRPRPWPAAWRYSITITTAISTSISATGPISQPYKRRAQVLESAVQNDGRGNFKDVTEKAGLAGAGFDNGVAIGDYDNDGYKDIFIGGVHRNRLYHNNGNGTFSDVTEKAGLQSARTNSTDRCGQSAGHGWT